MSVNMRVTVDGIKLAAQAEVEAFRAEASGAVKDIVERLLDARRPGWAQQFGPFVAQGIDKACHFGISPYGDDVPNVRDDQLDLAIRIIVSALRKPSDG